MIELCPAAPQQLPLLHAMEQDVDTAPYILATTIEQHRQAFARDEITYLCICARDSILGFLILALDADDESIELRRIVVANKGQGIGREALLALENWCLQVAKKRRIWLDVFTFNQRGRRLYAALGYRRFDQQEFRGKKLLLLEKSIAPG